MSDRVAAIGCGAIGMALIEALNRDPGAPSVGALLYRRVQRNTFPDLQHFQSLAGLLAWRPSLAVECAGHAAVGEYLPPLLEAGIDVILASVGALADAAVAEKLAAAAEKGNARLVVVSGAIGGIDALRAARHAGLDQVTYVGRKPPKAWAGTPAAQSVDLEALTEATTVFEGTAREAARLYPRNANVTATVAFAGLGLDRTQVHLIADPATALNIHELDAAGAFGRLNLRLENAALPGNPRSSHLASLSLEHAVREHFRHIKI